MRMWAGQPVPRIARAHTQLSLRTCLRSPSWDLRRLLTTGLSAITQDADRQRLPLGQLWRLQPSCNDAAREKSCCTYDILSSRWLVAEPPAPCRTFGAAANKLPGARRLQHWGGGPKTVYPFPRRGPHLLRRGWRRQQRRWGERQRSYLRI